MSLPIIQTIQNNINNLKIVKNDIKNAVNTDYNFITNEQIESYPDLIKQSIAYYKNKVPHAIKEGTNLNFNAAPLKFDNMTIKGNAEQEQLSGKNLYGISDYEGTFKSVEVKIKDGEIMLNGTADSNGTLYIEPKNTQILNGTYMITNIFISGTQTGGGNINLRNASDNTVIDGTQLSFGDSVRKITLNNKNIKYGIYLASGATFNSFKIKPQIVTGDVPDYDYEPYCGGQASPNPDYPQNIEVVTGDNVVKHVGKNLFVGYDNMLNGFLPIANNYPTVNSSYPNAKYQILELKAGESITTTIDANYSEGRIRAIDAKTNKIISSIELVENDYYSTTETYAGSFRAGTITAKKDLLIGVMLLKRPMIDLSFQIEYGNTPTPYEPFREKDYELNLGNIELCKIGNYQDILFKNEVGDENYNAELDDGVWYKKKTIDKKVLDESWTWFMNSVNRFSVEIVSPNGDYVLVALCDKFINALTWTEHTNTDKSFIVRNGNWGQNKCRISFLDSDYASLAEWTQFVSENNLIVYHRLLNPTYEKIIDQTLVSQLEALSKAKGNDGTTIITTNGEGLDPVLNFIAYLKEV